MSFDSTFRELLRVIDERIAYQFMRRGWRGNTLDAGHVGGVLGGSGGSGAPIGIDPSVTSPILATYATQAFSPERWTVDGRISAISGVGGQFVVPSSRSISRVLLACAALGSASSTIVDLNRNGSSLFVDATRPTLAHDDADGYAAATPDQHLLAEGDLLTLDIDQAATAAGQLDVQVEWGGAWDAWPAPPSGDLTGGKPNGSDTANIVLPLGASGAWDDYRISGATPVVDGDTVYLFYTGSSDLFVYQVGVASQPLEGFNPTSGWTKYASNPILSHGGSGDWDEMSVAGTVVLHDRAAGLWKMWFGGFDSWPGGTIQVGYATATSPFGPWTKYGGNPILSPTGWEGSILGIGSVMKRGPSDWVALYQGNEPASTDAAIGLLTSTDGISWSRYAGNPVISPAGSDWMQGAVFNPSTLILRDGTYYLYVAGKPSDLGFSKIGRATSTDLHTWTLDSSAAGVVMHATRTWEGAASAPGETEGPRLIRIGGSDYLFYDCWFGDPSTIGVAVVAVP
jgi:hypothetical protein